MFPENVKCRDGLHGLLQKAALIGRVQEDHMEFFPAGHEVGDGVPLDYLSLPGQAGELQVLPDQSGRILPLVHEGAPGRPPGQGLDTQLAGAGEQVQNVPAGDLKLYDIEQGPLSPGPVVGRVSIPCNSFNRRPRAEPEITRMSDLPFVA